MNKYLIVYHTEFSDTLENEFVVWDKITHKNILDFQFQKGYCFRTIVNIIKIDE